MATGVTGRSQRAMAKAHVEVMKNLNKAIGEIEGATLKGLVQAAESVRAASTPITPHKTGHLKGSQYVMWGSQVDGVHKSGPAQGEIGDDVIAEVTKEKDKMKAIIGYCAVYAVYVHEINKNYVVGAWKFLTRGLVQKQGDMLDIIKSHAEIEKWKNVIRSYKGK